MTSQAFTEHQIVPDVIDQPPTQTATVTYPKAKVNLGNEIGPVNVRQQPQVTYPAEKNAYYTLIMTDPDAPSRTSPDRKEARHWLVGNIPGSDVSKGQVISAYIGSGPPQGSGLHRYIFLIYQQPGKITFDEKHESETEMGERMSFVVRKFTEKYKLVLKAGNFYQAQYDDSVPELHKQLGFTAPAADV
ncbi:protein D2-like [Sitophilus oryzae]|uniref:Protein D2-like n=1 Tax=Sitophilus oryzae TaxID=7048 RepID=A0A6J2XUE2_SITOR|nr:protein D2-like [Sitophilus oryzae]